MEGSQKKKIVFIFSLGWNPQTQTMASDTFENTLTGSSYVNRRVDVAYCVVMGGVFAPGQDKAIADPMESWISKNCTPVKEGLTTLIKEDQSRTTRENILNAQKILNERGVVDWQNFDLMIVSEWWHLLGIKLLFFLLYRLKTTMVATNQKISLKAKLGRIVRLFIYLWDPRGTGWLTRKVTERRKA